jgi:predicted lipoprotein
MRSVLKINIVCCIISLLCFSSSCKKKDKSTNPDTTKDDFDRKAMLTNVGNNVILPAYQNFNRSCVKLDSTIVDFNLSPDITKLSNLQSIFKDTYRVWQSSSSFGFGPADDAYLSKNTNTFPTDSVKINSNLNSTYNLDAISNLDARGLPAMDYLLFGLATDNNSILIKYTTDGQATKRKQYLAALSAALKTNISTVLSNWSAGGNYMNTFLNATGTDVGSSLGQFINQLDFDLEILKNYKLGVPLGKQSMGTPFPAKVEAYYNGISSELALLQIKSIENIYLGKSIQGVDGQGLDDYLIKINAQYNGGSLNDAIKNQFSAAITKLQVVPDPLSNNITSNPTVVNAAYIEIQKLVVLLKTDLPSALGVLITYEDTDGD